LRPRFTRRTPLDGRPLKQLEELAGLHITLEERGQFELHPNGRRIAFEVGSREALGDQVWVLENVLPAVKR